MIPAPPTEAEMLRTFAKRCRKDPTNPRVHALNLIWAWRNAGYPLAGLAACITLSLSEIISISDRQQKAQTPFVAFS